MTKLAQFTGYHRSRERETRAPGETPRLRTRYYAFLSYSHKDKELADWLHRELEKFRVPHALAGKLTANGVVPRRLSPIFRDQHDLSAGGDLTVEIEAALAASQFLVVLCSPTAAKSHWTNLEIESFKRTRPEGCVLAAVVAGEPFASDIRGREDEECFPPALRYKYDRRGHRTARRADPLAADFREGRESNRTAFLKLVAGMLGVGLDELVQRETVRRQKRLAYLAAASLAGMAVTSGLAVTAIQARDQAREQRREAEGLIGFMLGDLKDKLEPIGRLDALDGVGARVLTYYQRQGTSDLSDAALSQRSRALSLMGEVANLRGDMAGSLRLYREAMAGTAEAVRRNPDDPERLFEHAQNVFWIGALAQQRGDFGQAEAAYRQYRDLGNSMVALQPDNLKWRMEVEDSEVDLANVLLAQRRFPEATAQFVAAVQTMEAVSAVDPKAADYRKSVADTLAWLADAQFAQGKISDAIASRRRQVDLLRRMATRSGDVGYRERLIPALAALGRFLATSGDLPAGLDQVKESVTEGDALLPNDPTNSRWMNYVASSKLTYAQLLLKSGREEEANDQANAGCSLTRKLIATDKSIVAFQTLLISCQQLKAQLAASSGDYARALQSVEQGLVLANSVNTGDDTKVMRAERLLGDYRQRMGDSSGARQAWQAGNDLLASNARQRPSELAERSKLLQRLGQADQARQIADYLESIGYRNLD